MKQKGRDGEPAVYLAHMPIECTYEQTTLKFYGPVACAPVAEGEDFEHQNTIVEYWE